MMIETNNRNEDVHCHNLMSEQFPHGQMKKLTVLLKVTNKETPVDMIIFVCNKARKMETQTSMRKCTAS